VWRWGRSRQAQGQRHRDARRVHVPRHWRGRDIIATVRIRRRNRRNGPMRRNDRNRLAVSRSGRMTSGRTRSFSRSGNVKLVGRRGRRRRGKRRRNGQLGVERGRTRGRDGGRSRRGFVTGRDGWRWRAVFEADTGGKAPAVSRVQRFVPVKSDWRFGSRLRPILLLVEAVLKGDPARC
jgi:hypothetical protein